MKHGGLFVMCRDAMKPHPIKVDVGKKQVTCVYAQNIRKCGEIKSPCLN